MTTGARAITAVGYQAAWRKRPLVKIIRKILFYLLLLVLFFPFFFVFAWMLEGAFKTQVQNTAIPPLFIFEPTLKNFGTVFQKNPMWDFLRNSTFVAVGATGLALLFGLPAAYTIARFKQQKLAVAILVARIMPGISFLVPWFIMFSKVNMIGTYYALLLSPTACSGDRVMIHPRQAPPERTPHGPRAG